MLSWCVECKRLWGSYAEAIYLNADLANRKLTRTHARDHEAADVSYREARDAWQVHVALHAGIAAV